jgi:hypothetical protein
MRKGQKVVLLLLSYCIVSWLLRGEAWAPTPLLGPERVADLVPRDALEQPEATVAAAPRFTRPVEELLGVPEATAAEIAKSPTPPPNSWQGFLEKLRALERGERDKVRAVHWGDSELVADGTAGEIRRVLGERYGLGGLGFSLPMLPLPWYLRDHIRVREGIGVRVSSYVHGRKLEGSYGPGGVAFDVAPGTHAFTTFEHPVPGPCTFEVYFGDVPEPGAVGRVQVRGDGAIVLDAPAAASAGGVGSASGRADPCPREVALETTEANVRVFGWSIEYDRPGVVWSNTGVVAAQVTHLMHYAPGKLEAALAALRPDLVVLTFGLNIASFTTLPPASHRDDVRAVLARVRAALPEAACLVTGPYPVGQPTDDGINPESRNAAIIAREDRAAAEAEGCVFLDRYALAGGAPAARRWVAARPKLLSGDYVHLTVEGADRMGGAIAGLIVAAADRVPFDDGAFRLVRPEEEPRTAMTGAVGEGR